MRRCLCGDAVATPAERPCLWHAGKMICVTTMLTHIKQKTSDKVVLVSVSRLWSCPMPSANGFSLALFHLQEFHGDTGCSRSNLQKDAIQLRSHRWADKAGGAGATD